MRWAALGMALLAAGALAGVVVAGQFDDGSDLASAVDEAPLTQVAEIDAEGGAAALGVYLQRTKTGHLCVWEAPSATSRQRGGGCNPIDDPLGGDTISATLSYNGGPGISRVSEATAFGLAEAEVAAVRILMSDGSLRMVKLKKAKLGSDAFQAFGYRFKKKDLANGVGPVAFVAYDADGVELGRQPTGIG